MTGETGHNLRGDYSRMRPDYTVDQAWQAYTPAEHDLWRRLFRRQQGLVPRYACNEFIETLDTLGYLEGIPRFDAINEKLVRATGWRLVAVPGLVPDLVFFEERGIFPAQIEPGMQFDGLPEGATTEGMPADAVYTVTEVYPTHVVLDGNHPLAGIALRLDLVVRDVREATDAEIEAGSVGQPVFTVMNTAPSGPSLH